MEELRVREPVANALLDHIHETGVAQHYGRTQYLNERRAVLEAWTNRIK